MRLPAARASVLPAAGASWLLAPMLLAVCAAVSTGQGDKLPDPLPLQRLQIPAERLAAEIERLRLGTLVQMPRGEFEDLVQRAARAVADQKQTPRITRAVYSAELVGTALAHGSGHWAILRGGAATAVLPLPSFNLALSRMQWANGAGALVGNLDGKNLGLLVEQGGDLFFDWSLHGTAVPAGLQFELRLPPCPVNTLELKLPADHQLVVPKAQALVTGPHEAETPGKKIWRVQFTGHGQIELLVRRPPETQQVPRLLLAQTQTRVQLAPGRAWVDFELQVDILHASQQTLNLECDPGLEPYEVSARNADIKGWEFLPAGPPSDVAEEKKEPVQPPSLLQVHLRDPVLGSVQGLRVRCLARRLDDAPWTCPFLRLRQAQQRGESLKIHIHPDLQLLHWDSAGFKLLSSGVEADGGQVLSLTDPVLGLAATKRPVALVKAQTGELRAGQRTWWSLEPRGSTLTSKIVYEVSAGSVHQLSLKLPAPVNAWRLEAVETEPADALRSWYISGPLLFVELERGITPRAPLVLSLRLKRSWDGGGQAARTLDLPVLEPLEVQSRRGYLAIAATPDLRTALLKSSTPPQLVDETLLEKAPLPDLPLEKGSNGPPRHFFAYRDKSPTGQVRLLTTADEAAIRCRQHVSLGETQGSWQAELEVDPVVGAPTHVDLLIASAAPAPPLHLQHNGSLFRVAASLPLSTSLHGLLGLGPYAPGAPLLLPVPWPRVERYRLLFHTPLEKQARIVLQASLRPTRREGAAATWDIPLVLCADTARLDAEVSVAGLGVDLAGAAAQGLEDALGGPATKPESIEARRLFRYGSSYGDAIPQLTVWTGPPATRTFASEVCDQAQFVTYVDGGRQLVHHLRFHVVNSQQRHVSVWLPPDTSAVLGAKLDGRWLGALRQQVDKDGVRLDLPFDAGRGRQRFEVYFASELHWGGWPSRADVAGKLPKLSIPPETLERSWWLAPGLLPWHQDDLQAHADMPHAQGYLKQMWRAGAPLLAEFWPGRDTDDALRQVFLGAESALRKKLPRDATLGQALERLVLDYVKGQTPLLVDMPALEALGVGPTASLAPAFTASQAGRPFWEALDLAVVFLPSAAVLTSREQAETSWQPHGRHAGLDEALRHASDLVLDSAGSQGTRFRLLADWLTQPVAEESSTAAAFPTVPRLPSIDKGWTRWTAVPTQPAAPVWIVHSAALHRLGAVLAALLSGLCWRWRGLLRTLWGFRLSVLVLGAMAVFLNWLPTTLQPLLLWPLLAFLGVLAVLWLVAVWRRPGKAARPARSTDKAIPLMIGSSTLWLLFMPGSFLPSAQSQKVDEVHPVLLIERAGKQQVLVTPELLKKLSDLERKSSVPVGAVLLGARYDGQVHGGMAEFRAVFDLHCFADQARVTIPLTGVDLKEGMLLDGAVIYPVPAPNAKAGYQVTVRGKGSHRLTLSFTTRVLASGDSQEVRFQGPKLCRTYLEVAVPATFQGVHAPAAQGQTEVARSAGTGPQMVKAHLGREGQAVVRWRLESASGTPTAGGVEVQEAYFWDLRPQAGSLTAVLNYVPGKGNLNQLALLLPEEVEVRSVEALVPPAGPGPPGSALKKWRLLGKGPDRQLVLELNAAGAPRVQVLLGLTPRLSLAPGSTLLRLPVPLAAKQTTGFLAYRLEGLEAEDSAVNLSIAALKAEVFAKEWASFAQRDPGPATRAYSFRRFSPKAGLTLKLAAPRPDIRAEFHWKVLPEHAEFLARASVSSANKDVSLIEVVLPTGLHCTDVRGPSVHHWSRNGDLVQVWLQEPRGQAQVELAGWTPLPQKATEKSGLFRLPRLSFPQANVQGVVTVRPAPGLHLEVGKLVGLTSGGDGAFTMDAPTYDASFAVRRLPPQPQVRVLNLAEWRDNECLFESHLLVQSPSAQVGTFRLILRAAANAEVRLELPQPAQAGAPRRLGPDTIWDIKLGPDTPQPFVVRLAVRLPLKLGDRVMLPLVELENAVVSERWLALVGLDPTEATAATAPVKTVSTQLRGWPALARRLEREGKTWRLEAASKTWSVTARPVSATPAAQGLLGEQSAFLGASGRWLHQAEYWLAVRSETEVLVALPGQARLLAACVDGRPVTPRLIGPQRISVPLPGPAGARRLQLRWEYPPADESLSEPILARARLVKLATFPIHGRVLVPAGWRAPALPAAKQLSAAQRLLDRVRALDQLARFLADHATVTADVEKAFFWELDAAEIALVPLSDTTQKEAFHKTILELRRAHLAWARSKNLERVSTAAEKQPTPLATPTSLTLPSADMILLWQASAEGDDLSLALTAVAPQRHRAARMRSELWILLVVLLLVLSYVPRGWRLAGRLWPECAMMVGLAGTLAWGPSWIGLALLAAGVVARGASALRGLRRLLSYLFTPRPSLPAAP